MRIQESEKEKKENGDLNNDALIYGMVYGDLQFRLLEHFEGLEKDQKVVPVVNSWNSEVETWSEEE